MKTSVITFAALLMLAGATLSANATTKKSSPTSTDSVPVASCPPSDPNGCGILGK